MAGYETAIVRLRGWAADRPTAGLGLLLGSKEVVTCAHVVNTALGRGQREQEPPGESELVQVDFPLMPATPVRLARTVPSGWAPPPLKGMDGGDVAGLMLTEDAPVDAARARFAAAAPEPGARLRVFGYPGSPVRQSGVWVNVDLKGEVGGQLIQVESRGDQTIHAQPGFSGSPVWNPGTGEVVGLLKVAPFADKPERDAYLMKPLAIAQAWEEPFDYLLVPENPYRGLEPFTAEHAAVFFGRDTDIRALTARVSKQPVVIVVGPSGVGKSSLVQAGLIPALHQHQRWSVALVRPGQDPWLRLAAGLLRAQKGPGVLVTPEESERESDRLKAKGFTRAAQFLRSEDRPLLVVVDQFEELLATGEGPDQDLLDLLLPSPNATVGVYRLVLTLRADFLPALQSIPGFHERLNERLYLLSPLTVEQMREATVRPAAARGVAFQPGLVDQILSHAAGGALPVLEFTLAKLWELQRQRTLTFIGYQQMGGVQGALDRFSEEKTVQLTEAAAEVLDRVLLRLVRTPAGPDLAVRQRIFKSEFSMPEWEVVQRLAEARLVILDTGPADREPYAELAHESLITAWERLAALVAENAEFLTWLARVQQRAADGDPLPEARIAEARSWLDTRPGDIPDVIRAFIENSETAAEARLRELRDARARAEEAAREAEARRLAAASELALAARESQRNQALVLAIESLRIVPTIEGDKAARTALRTLPLQHGHLERDSQVLTVDYCPNGIRVATGSEDGKVLVFDAETGVELIRVDHDDAVWSIAFSPDGTRLATGSNDHSAQVFDVTIGTELCYLDHDDAVLAVAFSPDGTRVATASNDHSARVFHVRKGAEICRVDHDDAVLAVVFSPDGTRVATASKDTSARVFDAATGTEVCRVDHDDAVLAVAFSPDGTRVATASNDTSARVFDAATGTEVCRVDHDDMVWTVVFSPDGTRVATGSHDRSARVFNAETGREMCRMDHDDAVLAVAFSPDGTRVATSGTNRGGPPVWTVDESEFIRQAEERIASNLTRAEWRKYFGKQPYRLTCPNLGPPAENRD